MDDLDNVLDSIQDSTSSLNPDTLLFDAPEPATGKNPPALKPKKKIGHPVTLDWAAIEKKVIDLITTTPDSVKTICRKAGVSQQTWFEHMMENLSLAEKYSIAKESQTALRIEELDAEAAKIATKFKDEDPRKTAVRVSLYKITSDNKRWIAERMLPKKYGSRQTIDANLAGQASAPAIKIEFTKPEEK